MVVVTFSLKEVYKLLLSALMTAAGKLGEIPHRTLKLVQAVGGRVQLGENGNEVGVLLFLREFGDGPLKLILRDVARIRKCVGPEKGHEEGDR